jgi:hypothetical protein
VSQRLKRKFRVDKDLGLEPTGDLFGEYTNDIKKLYRLNEDEINFISENATENECDILLSEPGDSIYSRRLILQTLNKLLNLYEVVTKP